MADTAHIRKCLESDGLYVEKSKFIYCSFNFDFPKASEVPLYNLRWFRVSQSVSQTSFLCLEMDLSVVTISFAVRNIGLKTNSIFLSITCSILKHCTVGSAPGTTI